MLVRLLAFIISFAALLSPWKVAAFTPFILQGVHRAPKGRLYVRAVSCGVLIDLFSSATPFGLSSLNFVIALTLLYPLRLSFFEDKLLTWPLLTSLFSFLSTLLMLFLRPLFGQGVAVSGRWFLTDLVFASFLDGLYALIFFVLPFQFTPKLVKLVRRRKV